MTSLFRLGFLYDPGISHFPHQTSLTADANTTLIVLSQFNRLPHQGCISSGSASSVAGSARILRLFLSLWDFCSTEKVQLTAEICMY
ncbi:hypothetical protein GJAV_G00111340 [Gymnothorax javanicus]|nr:hypothetical protein GJAV_G00111340 [Gymnothorax javanicus]